MTKLAVIYYSATGHGTSMARRVAATAESAGAEVRLRHVAERAEIGEGALYVGSPETVAAKIARTASLLGLDRFDLKYSHGQLPHEKLMHSIELYGTRVIPLVREILAAQPAE